MIHQGGGIMYRAILGALLLALALPVAGRAQTQGPDLATMVLTAADVPQGLRASAGQSGPQTRDGIRGYQATFEGDPLSINPGSGGVMSVINLVTMPADPVTGLDEFVRGARQGIPGTPTDLPPPPVGEDGRAFTASAGIGPFSVGVAGTAFRRNGVVVGVMVMNAGGQPQTDESLRLAQIVDQRVQAATGAPR
jgi:hypothetical protein